MKRAAVVVLVGFLLLVGAVAGGAWWVWSSVDAMLTETVSATARPVPIPWPLTEAEREQILAEADPEGPAPDLDAIALQRAQARGARTAWILAHCHECHGDDYGGHVMADDPAFGTWVAPDISQGSAASSLTDEQLLVLLRHGVTRDGRRAVMPSVEHYAVSFPDRDVSDLIAWFRTIPAAPARELPEPRVGPVLAMLLYTGEIQLPYDVIDHAHVQPAEPPPAGPTAEYGAHLGHVCTICHYEDLRGGPPLIGGPEMLPAPNITVGPDGLDGFTRDDFDAAIRAGRSKGRTLDSEVMPWDLFAQLHPEEVDALWAWLQTVPPGPAPARD